MEILADGGVYYRLVFVAGADGSSLRIHEPSQPDLVRRLARVVRVCVHGLPQPPEIREGEKAALVVRQGTCPSVAFARLTVEGDRFIVEIMRAARRRRPACRSFGKTETAGASR